MKGEGMGRERKERGSGNPIFLHGLTPMSPTKYLTDRQRDGRTGRPLQYHALHYMQSHGKNRYMSRRNRLTEFKLCTYYFIAKLNTFKVVSSNNSVADCSISLKFCKCNAVEMSRSKLNVTG